MLKSFAVVIGSYLLSVVLVVATDRCSRACSRAISSKAESLPTPLSWRARRSSSSSQSFAHGSAPALLRAAPRDMCSGFYRRRSNGHRRDHSQLEQRLAALVLVVVAADLAGELLDRPAAGRTPGGFALRLSCDLTP